MQQITFNVQGMSCGSCVNKIERNVDELNGVESVKVQLSEEKVNVVFNESAIDLKNIKDAIKNSGYEVKEEPIEEEESGCSCCS